MCSNAHYNVDIVLGQSPTNLVRVNFPDYVALVWRNDMRGRGSGGAGSTAARDGVFSKKKQAAASSAGCAASASQIFQAGHLHRQRVCRVHGQLKCSSVRITPSHLLPKARLTSPLDRAFGTSSFVSCVIKSTPITGSGNSWSF